MVRKRENQGHIRRRRQQDELHWRGEIKVGLYNNTLVDRLCVTMGNCFRNDKQALTNKNVIVKRIEKATELLEKLRNEGGE